MRKSFKLTGGGHSIYQMHVVLLCHLLRCQSNEHKIQRQKKTTLNVKLIEKCRTDDVASLHWLIFMKAERKKNNNVSSSTCNANACAAVCDARAVNNTVNHFNEYMLLICIFCNAVLSKSARFFRIPINLFRTRRLHWWPGENNYCIAFYNNFGLFTGIDVLARARPY